MRILVIDSDPQTVGLVEATAGSTHEVVSMASGFAALERIAIGRAFDIIFCELDLPDLSGKEIHKRLAESAPTTAAKLVFLVTDMKAHRPFLDGLRNHYLQRPFNAAGLRETIRAMALR
jgi:two-component system NtrC family sensor kinase